MSSRGSRLGDAELLMYLQGSGFGRSRVAGHWLGRRVDGSRHPRRPSLSSNHGFGAISDPWLVSTNVVRKVLDHHFEEDQGLYQVGSRSVLGI